MIDSSGKHTLTLPLLPVLISFPLPYRISFLFLEIVETWLLVGWSKALENTNNCFLSKVLPGCLDVLWTGC